MRRAYDAIVIGAGIHGCSAALNLAADGAKVVVLEKDYAGRHASGVNAGGVRRLGRDLREVALAVESLKLWQCIGDLVDDDCGFIAKGHVEIAETEAELAGQRRRIEALARRGFSHERLIGGEELRRIVPAVAPHCVGGIHVAEDGAAMPYQTTFAFRQKARALGVEFREGTEVKGLSRSGAAWRATTANGSTVEAPVVVNCAGAWAAGVCAQLGEPVPLEPIAPMLMITAPLPHFVDPVVGAAGRVLSFKQYANGTVLIGGGLTGRVDMARNRAELDFAKLSLSARTARDLFPVMAQTRVVRAWAGIEARMPDNIPVIGRSSRHEGVLHAFGFSAHGFQLGPIVGRVIADLVGHGRTPIDIAAFDIGRFDGAVGFVS